MTKKQTKKEKWNTDRNEPMRHLVILLCNVTFQKCGTEVILIQEEKYMFTRNHFKVL